MSPTRKNMAKTNAAGWRFKYGSSRFSVRKSRGNLTLDQEVSRWDGDTGRSRAILANQNSTRNSGDVHLYCSPVAGQLGSDSFGLRLGPVASAFGGRTEARPTGQLGSFGRDRRLTAHATRWGAAAAASQPRREPPRQQDRDEQAVEQRLAEGGVYVRGG